MKKKLRIGHLYPKLLNIYGDKGNVITLQKRAEWRGVEVNIDEINSGDREIGEHDIYFIGGGQDTQQIEVSKELQKHKEFLTAERDRGAVFLGICGGYQLMGNYYQPHEGNKLMGISLLDAYTVAGNKRFIGNVTVDWAYMLNNITQQSSVDAGRVYQPDNNFLVGFENHSGQDKTEGARYKNVFGTYMHGSFLPKNPKFADYLLELALGEKLEPLDDTTENNAHNALINKAY